MTEFAQTLLARSRTLCDSFIREDLQADFNLFLRARILVALLLVSQLIIIASLFFALLVLPPTSLRIAVVMMLAMLLVQHGVLRYLRRTSKLQQSITFTISITVILINASITMSGGPLLSPAISFAILPALLAFGLGGRRIGVIWSIVALLIFIGLLIAQTAGMEFPNLSKNQGLDARVLFNWCMAFVCVVGIMLMYEVINGRLQSERDKLRVNFQYLASYDVLTGLANRNKFFEELTLAIDRAARHGRMVGLIYIDLDGFKPINDRCGHEVGDRVLQNMTVRIIKNIRNIDTAARIGGDEFAVILEAIDTVDEAVMVATKLCRAIAQPLTSLPEFPISASIGIAIAPLHSDDAATLIKQADHAMYRAKQNKNAVVLFDEESGPIDTE